MNYDTEIQIHKNAIGSKTKLQESLLEAVQILHDGFIVNEKIPKTLECRIADDSKKDEGIYIVDYMNNKFEVSCFLDETFNVNDIVCVLVPDGDFAKTKIIIGSSDGSGEAGDQATKAELNEAVTTLQTNFQAGVDAIGAACTRKGSPPASHSLKDTVAAIDAITTGGNYATLEVREDGEYKAAEDPRGIDAYDIVVVSKDVGQPHTVVFYGPDGSIIQTQANVPYHGYASCTLLDGTTYLGQYFKGWNPHPTNVVEDMFCYPQYGDYIIDPGEISDDWETICTDSGAHYPLGSYKSLNVIIPILEDTVHEIHDVYINGSKKDADYTYRNIKSIIISMEMRKVAEGEDGSSSTWLSSGTLGFGYAGICPRYGSNVNTWSDYYYYDRGDGVRVQTLVNMDWGTCFLRKYLNEHLISNIPPVIASNIKGVTKQYSSWSVAPSGGYYNQPKVEKSCIDKIWVPSMRELHTMFSSVSNYNDYSSMEEFSGIDYSSVYIPNYGKFAVRTNCCGSNYNNPLFLQPGHSITPVDQGCGQFPFGFCL